MTTSAERRPARLLLGLIVASAVCSGAAHANPSAGQDEGERHALGYLRALADEDLTDAEIVEMLDERWKDGATDGRVEMFHKLRDDVGAVDIRSIEADGAAVVVAVSARSNGRAYRFEFEMESVAPFRIVRVTIGSEGTTPPPVRLRR